VAYIAEKGTFSSCDWHGRIQGVYRDLYAKNWTNNWCRICC